MNRFVVVRVGELLPAEEAAERALARTRREARHDALRAHARSVVEAIRAEHAEEDVEVWIAAMRKLVTDQPVLVSPRACARQVAQAVFSGRAEGDVPSAGGEP